MADTWNHRIQKFTGDGTFLTQWGGFIDLGNADEANDSDKGTKFYGPRGVAIGPDGNLYVADTGNKRISIFKPDGTYVREISSGKSADKIKQGYAFNQNGEMNEPIGVAVDAQGNVYVADLVNHRIQKFDVTGAYAAQWPIPSVAGTPAPDLEPFLALDAQGNLYATAPTNAQVYKFDPHRQAARPEGHQLPRTSSSRHPQASQSARTATFTSPTPACRAWSIWEPYRSFPQQNRQKGDADRSKSAVLFRYTPDTTASWHKPPALRPCPARQPLEHIPGLSTSSGTAVTSATRLCLRAVPIVLPSASTTLAERSSTGCTADCGAAPFCSVPIARS